MHAAMERHVATCTVAHKPDTVCVVILFRYARSYVR